MKKLFILFFSCLSLASQALAGTITGQIQTPSTGRGVANGTLTFTLSQAAVVSGTATLAGNGVCWTDSAGNVVGLPGDSAVAAPVLSSNLASGSLPAGTYFVRYTWANATGESQPSTERSLVLGSSGTLILQAPVNVPALATSMKIYVGTTSGGETLQGSVTVTGGVIGGNYSQSAALVGGAALPSGNTSTCQIRFNDELQPSFTAYSVAFTNVNGAGIAGFPQKWYLSGGSNGTVNVSNGTPLYAGVVQYPQAIVSNPAASGTQSINGGLNLNGFNLSSVGTYTSSGTGSLKVTNPGDFSAGGLANYQNYGAVNVNNLNPQSEQTAIGRGAGNVQDALYGAINVPATDTTVTQLDAVAGYISNASPSADPVAIYGQARANYNTAGQNQSWAANLLCSDTVGMTQNGSCYGLEIDVSKFTNKISGWAQDFNGNFNSVGGTYGGLLFVKPNNGQWSPGIAFGVGATPFVDNQGNGAILLDAVAAGANQASQGISFRSNDPGSGVHYFGIGESATGDLTIGVPNVATRLAVGGDGTTQIKRLQVSLGTNLGSGNFAISAGWGNTANVNGSSGQDGDGAVTVLSNGTGQSTNPTITLTFADGAWPKTPLVAVSRCDTASPNAYWAVSTNTTALTLTFVGTPVAGNTYCAEWIAAARSN